MSVEIADILDIVSRQNHWRGKETINLIASENVQSDAVKNIEINEDKEEYQVTIAMDIHIIQKNIPT